MSSVEKKLSRRAFLVGSAVLTGSILVACAPAAPTAAPAPKEEAKPVEKKEEAKAAPKEAVVLKFHDRAGSHADWHKKQEAKFEEQNPGLSIEFDEIPGDHVAKQYALAASGTIGDVVWCYNNAMGEAVRKGVPRAIDDLVQSEKVDTAVWWPAILACYKWEGKLYGLPNHGHYGTNIWYINEDLFSNAGVKLPTPDWTVDDLVEAGKKITKAPEIWGVRTNGAGGEHVPQYLRTFGGNVMNPEGTKAMLDSDGSKAAIKWLYDLKATHKVDPCICGDKTRDNFVAGQVGAYNWTPGYAAEFSLIKDWKFKWSAMVAPKGPGGQRGSQASGAAFCVTKASKHPTEAFQVLKFFSTKEDGIEHVYGGAGSPGPRNDVWESQRLNDFNPIYKIIVAAFPNGPDAYYFPKNLRVAENITTVDNNLAAIWTDKVGMDEGIATLQKAVQEILDRESL
jgi:multiple sugar transport system substrate-binding protein